MSIPTPALMRALESLGVTGINIAFQPIVGRSRALWAWEALLRGIGTSGAVVLPEGILRASVASGGMIELGTWARHIALQHYGRLDRLGVAARHLCLNARRDEVGPEDFVKDLLESACAADIDPCRIIIELTEDEAEIEHGVLLQRRGQIADARMQLALDDCGPYGMNSPSEIQALNPEIVKVDMRLLAVPSVLSEVGSIIKSAREIGALVVVERVEDEEQFSDLFIRGVDLYQGSLFGMPKLNAEKAP